MKKTFLDFGGISSPYDLVNIPDIVEFMAESKFRQCPPTVIIKRKNLNSNASDKIIKLSWLTY